MATIPTRGERNNNPFNLKKTDIKWQGKVDSGSDPVFEQFVSPLLGIRAGFKNLLEQGREGNNTVYLLITKYAPPNENNTNQYMKSVCQHLNVNPDDKIDLDNYDTLYAIGSAIILHENGRIIYNDALINQAMQLAGVHDAPTPSVATCPEAKAAAGATVMASVTAVGAATQALSPTIPLVQQLVTSAPWIATAIGVGVIGYLGYRLYLKYHQQVI